MRRRASSVAMLATLLLFLGGLSAQAADQMFTVHVQNVSVGTSSSSPAGDGPRGSGAGPARDPHGPRPPVHVRRAGPRQGAGGLGGGRESGPAGGIPQGPVRRRPRGHCQPRRSGPVAPGRSPPGGAYEFTVTAKPGERLTIAMMFGQSNDLFYAPREEASRCSTGWATPSRETSRPRSCSGRRD